MISSSVRALQVGDIVDHDVRREGYPDAQGKGLLTRLVKKGSHNDHNLWEVRFFAGTTFEIMEEYLKKIQGALDFDQKS